MWFKGIVIDIKDSYSIVIKDDNEIVRVKNKEDMNIGDVVIFLEEDVYEEKESKKIKSKTIISLLSIAVVLAIFVIPIIQGGLIKSYALVSLDVNPSIQFELDKNKKIVNVYGINEDAKKLKLNELKGLTLDEGITQLKINLKESKYNLENNSAIVGFTFLTNKKDNSYENEIKDIMGKELKGVKIAYLKGTKEGSKVAKEKGISLGRYEAELSMNEDVMEEQIENMSVEEILNMLSGKKNIYLNEEMKEELQDELEDKTEDKNEHQEEENEHDDSDEDDSYENGKDYYSDKD